MGYLRYIFKAKLLKISLCYPFRSFARGNDTLSLVSRFANEILQKIFPSIDLSSSSLGLGGPYSAAVQHKRHELRDVCRQLAV